MPGHAFPTSADALHQLSDLFAQFPQATYFAAGDTNLDTAGEFRFRPATAAIAALGNLGRNLSADGRWPQFVNSPAVSTLIPGPPAERLPTLFRVVDHDPPVRDDFLSDEERDAPPAAHETRWHRQGLSVFDKIGLARGLAKWRLRKGFVSKTFVAAVVIEDGAPIYAKPSPPPTGHWTLWGDPNAICVRARVVERLGDDGA